MKRLTGIILMIVFLIMSCGGETGKKVEEAAKSGENAVKNVEETIKDKISGVKALIIYYSETGTTEKVANSLADTIKNTGITVDIEKITPKEAYNQETMQDVVKKQFTDKIYPEINPVNKNIADYNLIIIGTPAWFGQPAQPLIGYLQSQDFTGKKVAIYSTFGGNAGDVLKNTESYIKGATFLPGVTLKGEEVKADKYLEALKPWALGLFK